MCRESWYIAENAAHEARADGPGPRGGAAALLRHLPRRGARRARRRRSAPATSPPSPSACARGRDDLAGRGHEAGRRASAAAVLDLGDHPLPDPGRPGPLPPGAARQPRPCPRAAPRPTAAPSGSPSTRCCGCAPTSPPRAAAPSTTAPGAPPACRRRSRAIANFKGGVGKTSMAAHLAMSAALDGYRVLVVDLDSQGSMTSIFGGRVADEWDTVFPLIARDYALGLAGREPPPGRARRPAPAPRRDARRRAREDRRRRHPEDPLAEHRPDRRPAQPLLGRVPDPGLAHGLARLEALGGARQRASSATACSTATTSSSSIPPRPSAT